MRNNGRPRRYFDFAENWGNLLDSILPKSVCTVAAATCRFHFRGKEAGRNKAFSWALHTEMQTDGQRPDIPQTAQMTGKWVCLTSIDAANEILQAFGIGVSELLDHFGIPSKVEQYKVDLYEVVAALRPDFILHVAAA